MCRFFFAWTNAMREKMENPNPPVEQASIERDLDTIRSRLDEPLFASASAKGMSMTIEQAIADAIEV